MTNTVRAAKAWTPARSEDCRAKRKIVIVAEPFMNTNETIEMWLAEKRKLAPSTNFSQRIMASVEQSVASRSTVSKAFPQQSLSTSQSVPYWITSAAVVVCAMRTACFLQMLLEPTFEYSVVSQKTISEVPNVE
jgi:hypothetical protein